MAEPEKKEEAIQASDVTETKASAVEETKPPEEAAPVLKDAAVETKPEKPEGDATPETTVTETPTAPAPVEQNVTAENTATEAAAPAPATPAIPVSDADYKAATALNELLDNPEAAAVLEDPKKAEEYFAHLSTISGDTVEKAKEKFALKLQEFFKQKEVELAPQKAQMDGLQKQAQAIQARGQQLQAEVRKAGTKTATAGAIGAAALALIGGLSAAKMKSPTIGKTVAGTVGGLIVGGGLSLWAASKAFIGGVRKKGEALNKEGQEVAAQGQALQQTLSTQLRPAINQFVVAYVRDILVNSGKKAEQTLTAPVVETPAVEASPDPAKSSAMNDILSKGKSSSHGSNLREMASHVARAEEKAASVSSSGRAA